MAANTALIRGQAPAMTSSKSRGRARKRITYKEVGVGAIGAIGGGAGAAMLVRFGVPPIWACGGVAAGGVVGAAMTKNNWRAFFAGAGAGGGAMLAAAAAGAFSDRKEEKKKDGETKQIGDGGPAGAKNATPNRNASMTQQMRQEIAHAFREARDRQRQAA